MVSPRGVCFLLFLLLGSVFGSVFMLAPLLPLMLLSPSCYRWITDRIVATWLTLPVALLELVLGVKVVITGDGFIPGERSVIIMNHRTRLDWMFLWSCLLRYSYLRQEKICLKAALKSVPGFGWAMQIASFIFIQRRWEDDRTHMSNMLQYFCNIREPVQLLLFPEGTDLTENTRSRSDEFAEKNGLPKYEYVLHPRTTGFTFIVDTLRRGDNLDAVHDITVAYPQNIPQTERHLLAGVFPREIHFHVQRFEAASVPAGAAALQVWCQERWREKELRLQRFYGTVPRCFDVPAGGMCGCAPRCQSQRCVCVPRCKSERRVRIILVASLLYWSVFITAACASLCLCPPAQYYFLFIVIFFLCQQRVTGGLELMELACHRYWSRRSMEKQE